MAQLDYSIDPNFLMARLDYSFDPNLLMARPNFSIDPRAFSMVEPTKPWPNNPQTTQTFIKNATKTKRTPRPANAFIIYRRDKHFLVTHHDNNVVSKIIAEMWRHETEEIRSLYYQKAEQEKKDHFLKFPDYKYRPRKKKLATVPPVALPAFGMPLSTDCYISLKQYTEYQETIVEKHKQLALPRSRLHARNPNLHS